MIPGPLERNTGAGRLAGFMQAMKEAHISVPENWIVQGDFEPESGYRAMQQILNQQHRPTAVFCGGIGIFSSSLMRRSTFSNVCTYGILLLVVVGTYMLNIFLLNMSQMRIAE